MVTPGIAQHAKLHLDVGSRDVPATYCVYKLFVCFVGMCMYFIIGPTSTTGKDSSYTTVGQLPKPYNVELFLHESVEARGLTLGRAG